MEASESALSKINDEAVISSNTKTGEEVKKVVAENLQVTDEEGEFESITDKAVVYIEP